MTHQNHWNPPSQWKPEKISAAQGMVFGLLGVNGAGKTTSFKLMSGESHDLHM